LYTKTVAVKTNKGDRPDKRGKNVTLIAAMGLKGIVGSMTLFSVEQIP